MECVVATAEDTVLRKLEWYRAGGESSERQWNDLRGILQVNSTQLVLDYLRKLAGKNSRLASEVIGREEEISINLLGAVD